MQLNIDFTTSSPINVDKLQGQNRRLFDWLSSGHTIHCFSEAMKVLKIGYLNSRASDLKNRHNIELKKRYIRVPDSEGNLTSVVEYSL